MDDREYIQDENETSDWLVYEEYVEWTMGQNEAAGDVPAKD